MASKPSLLQRGEATLARLDARQQQPQPALPTHARHGYHTLPTLASLLTVDAALERRTAQPASAGTSNVSCLFALQHAEDHAHTTVLRARGILASFPGLWTSWAEEARLQRVRTAGTRPGL